METTTTIPKTKAQLITEIDEFYFQHYQEHLTVEDFDWLADMDQESLADFLDFLQNRDKRMQEVAETLAAIVTGAIFGRLEKGE